MLCFYWNLFQDEEEEIKLEINVLKKVCQKQSCFAVYRNMFCQYICEWNWTEGEMT